MREKIDYLALERKNHNEGSFNAYVKNLVSALRYVREGIPANEIQRHMPHAYGLEKKLQEMDAIFGEPPKEYVKEIWEVLENEPKPDEAKFFAICELAIRNENEVVLLTTGYSFPFHIIAEEWIKESGNVGTKYVILEVIENLSNSLP